MVVPKTASPTKTDPANKPHPPNKPEQKGTAATSQSVSGLVFKIVFLCVVCFSIVLGISLCNMSKSASDPKETAIRFLDHWTVTDQNGNHFDTGRIYNDDRAYSEDFTITTVLPDTIHPNEILCFLNRSNVQVYINGKLRESFDRVHDTGIPGGSLKEFYITIPLNPSDRGGELKMERHPTDWNPVVVSETFITTSQGMYHFLMNRYGTPFIFSVVLFVAALLVTIIGLVIRVWKKQTLDMLYAALGILDISCWLLSVSQITPFITGVYYVDGIMGYIFCMMMPFALLIYVNSIQKGRYKKCYTLLFILSLISFILWTSLHFAGIQSFQTSLVFIDSILTLVVVCAIFTLLMDIRNGHIKEYSYAAIGFLIFSVMSVFQIIDLFFFTPESIGIPMIIGLMAMLVMVVIQQVNDLRRIKNHLEEEVRDKSIENEQMLIHIVQTLAGTIDAKDTYTNGHSGRVADYSREIARRCGYSETELNDIYMMGLLHDIGKIGVPDAVINKPGKLTAEEYEIIKKHPIMGAKILENIKEKEELAMGARWHHEKYGGGGYPDGIKGEEIPEQARIIAVADAYDAMTSYRSYRDPMEQDHVRREIENGSGTQFDPHFAAVMLEMIEEDTDYQLREKRQD